MPYEEVDGEQPRAAGGDRGAPLFARVRASFWSRWAARLTDVRIGGELGSCAGLEHVEMPGRPPFVRDPVIAKVIGRRYDKRHRDYYRTIASWARYGMRPVSERRARALYAWSAAGFFMDDLIDGWETAADDLDRGSLVESQRALIQAIHRDNGGSPPRCQRSPRLQDACRVVRRASNLCFALRPSATWWEDYQREMTVFVHGRIVHLILAAGNAWLSPELYIRARALDIGGNTATVASGLSQGEYPVWSPGISRELAEIRALTWLHIFAINDLYSYYRERDENRFNLVHTVLVTASRRSPTSVRQAVDCVVRFCNEVWHEFRRRSDRLTASPRGKRSPGLAAHLRELAVNMMGNLEFVWEQRGRYRDPAQLRDYEVPMSFVGERQGLEEWTGTATGGLEELLDVDHLSRSCRDFALPRAAVDASAAGRSH